MKQKPTLTFWQIWNLGFGFFGVQIAYSLQGTNISRIFATLGADPHDLSYFWILPPLMGIIVQPIVGTLVIVHGHVSGVASHTYLSDFNFHYSHVPVT